MVSFTASDITENFDVEKVKVEVLVNDKVL
jgi:hypothetical protein